VASHPFKKDGVCNTLRLRSARPTTGVGRPGFQKVLPHTIICSRGNRDNLYVKGRRYRRSPPEPPHPVKPAALL